MEISSTRLFSWRQILVSTIVFIGITVAAQRALRYIAEHWVAFDCPYYWPVSVFNFRMPSVRDLVVAAAVTALFFLSLRFLERVRYGLGPVVLSGVLLIAGVTFIHGLEVGFYAPVASDAQSGVLIPYSLEGQEYYHDAVKVTSPVDFLKHYNEIQPTLHRHSHTHPPGAVLLFYFLEKVLRDPALIAVFIMLAATAMSVFFFRKLLLTAIGGETAGYTTFLLVLLPAVQIYYLASIDALIAGLLTGALYYFCFGKGHRSAAAAAGLLSVSFFLTFVSLFILPVLVGFDLSVRRSVKRSAIVLGALAAVYILLFLLTGYNPVESFRTASHFENPEGFMLFADPANYFFTRLEDVAEIIFFFGPFALLLMFRGFGKLRTRPLIVLTALACTAMAAMFVTGAWRTGETARACLYLYPYLLFPVAHYLEDTQTSKGQRMQLAALVIIQSIGMQVFGNYHW